MLGSFVVSSDPAGWKLAMLVFHAAASLGRNAIAGDWLGLEMTGAVCVRARSMVDD